MGSQEVDRLIRKAARNGPALSGEEREALQQHFADESDALALPTAKAGARVRKAKAKA